MGIALADASAPVTDGNGADDYKHALVVELAGRARARGGGEGGIEGGRDATRTDLMTAETIRP